MEDVIKEKLCNFCVNNKSKNCMTYKESKKNGVIYYMCENYEYKEKKKLELMEYIKYTFYDDVNNYIAIVKEGTESDKIEEMKQFFDEVKYKE